MFPQRDCSASISQKYRDAVLRVWFPVSKSAVEAGWEAVAFPAPPGRFA